MPTWTVTASRITRDIKHSPVLTLTVEIVEEDGGVSDTFDLTAAPGTEEEIRARVSQVVAERTAQATADAVVGMTGGL